MIEENEMNWKRTFLCSQHNTPFFTQLKLGLFRLFLTTIIHSQHNSLLVQNEIYLGLSFNDIIKITLNVIFFFIHRFVRRAELSTFSLEA